MGSLGTVTFTNNVGVADAVHLVFNQKVEEVLYVNGVESCDPKARFSITGIGTSEIDIRHIPTPKNSAVSVKVKGADNVEPELDAKKSYWIYKGDPIR